MCVDVCWDIAIVWWWLKVSMLYILHVNTHKYHRKLFSTAVHCFNNQFVLPLCRVYRYKVRIKIHIQLHTHTHTLACTYVLAYYSTAWFFYCFGSVWILNCASEANRLKMFPAKNIWNNIFEAFIFIALKYLQK